MSNTQIPSQVSVGVFSEKNDTGLNARLPGPTHDDRSPPLSYETKKKITSIQQQLMVLLHAHKCKQRQQNNGETCEFPHCKTMTNVLNHMETCTHGRSCQVSYCKTSRQIITHWINCKRNDCPICFPVRNVIFNKNKPDGRVLASPQETASAPRQPIASTTSRPNVTGNDIQRAIVSVEILSPRSQPGNQQRHNIRPQSFNSSYSRVEISGVSPVNKRIYVKGESSMNTVEQNSDYTAYDPKSDLDESSMDSCDTVEQNSGYTSYDSKSELSPEDYMHCTFQSDEDS